MQRHTRIFFKYWGYGDQHMPDCWAQNCGKPAVDIHHLIGRGQGGDPKKLRDKINNLYPLCRECHLKTDTDKEFNEELKKDLTRRLDGRKY